jgi:hypothetical protein
MEMAAQGWREPSGDKNSDILAKSKRAAQAKVISMPSIYISQIAFKKSAILWD